MSPATPLKKPGDGATDALLLIDWFGTWDQAEPALLPRVAAAATTVARLVAQARRNDVPVIFANDNFGQWRSDFHAVINSAVDAGGKGAAVAERLAPGPGDYVILKPRHSAFFGTPLDLLLAHLQTERLLVAGVASDLCVLATAIDAHLRDREVVVVRDACAAASAARHRRAMDGIAAFGIGVASARQAAGLLAAARRR
ncbi:isochorismatase family cysteine hydrolase [Tahibacter caeni]|uniref:isochorismatase family cysteine hydrolase n=1 Tax=Tahibacter caeni TaxID=1453545 RepID=UPI0021475483|nr:isochorismatase family cysteine hydrolase [Tahibacter caeni]